MAQVKLHIGLVYSSRQRLKDWLDHHKIRTPQVMRQGYVDIVPEFRVSFFSDKNIDKIRGHSFDYVTFLGLVRDEARELTMMSVKHGTGKVRRTRRNARVASVPSKATRSGVDRNKGRAAGDRPRVRGAAR